MAIAFALVMILSLIAVGFTIIGLLVGFGVGVVTIILLSHLVARSNRERSGGPPPPQLL